MYFKYGGYRHDDDEVNLREFSQQLIRSDRGKTVTKKSRMVIEVVMIASSQSAIKSKVQSLEAAYSKSADAGLYHDNGNASPHFLSNAGSLSGVRVVDLKYDKSDGAEYATGRTAVITLEADYQIPGGDNLLSWQETLVITGTGGPSFTIKTVLNGPPQKQIVAAATPVVAQQTGSAFGLLSRPFPPPPTFPNAERLDRRQIVQIAPKFQGAQYTDWGVAWNYYFESPTPLTGSPNYR